MLEKAWGEEEATVSHCFVPDMQEERQDARDVVYFGCSFINSAPLGSTINNLYSTGRHSFRNHSHLLGSCSWPPFYHHSSPHSSHPHLHSWSPAHHWPPCPPNKSKGAGRDNLFLADTDFSNSYFQLFTFLQFFLQFHFITDSDLCGKNAYIAHLPYGGDSN